MSNERILGNSEFVDSVISQSEKKYERHYELKRRGYDLNRICERVADIYGMEPRELFCRGKESLLFLGCQRAGHLPERAGQEVGNEPPVMGFSVERGEALAHENGYRLKD